MDGNIRPINPDDSMILPVMGQMKYRKDVPEEEQTRCSVIPVGSMHYAGFAEAMAQEGVSLETSEREAV